ncbi:MAG TPA: R3H domain-containing nucleic acid-binding protein [Bacilli bacterium]|jgi:spoIIIJ-associated protein|nr:Jag N-terminal domain-containing protein [Bacilli bacterium]HNZ73949.1 R3H domain-containing nucleic acid-binding protein [Bacilli bacterium]HOC97425.1 R3H domain-containing nucleic acid-binding protein [Bacilli bacterium]HOH58446.1 R3H domain-containing nucleic acid-binding protein [Bacilli bacterium]HPV54936.1 R3H domain-containing nucleic acid-binding protein [Bacilli bacterium]
MEKKTYEVKSIEEAYELVKEELGLDKDQVNIEVVEKKGLFKTKMVVEVSEKQDPVKIGEEYLKEILKANNIKGIVEKKVRDNLIYYNINAGDDNGYLIGRRSRYLIALQTLVSTAIYNVTKSMDINVIVDVAEYKQKRIDYLEGLAAQHARRVKETKKPIALSNLNAYERKIVHDKVASLKGVTTHSEGEGKDRHLIIEPTRD